MMPDAAGPIGVTLGGQVAVKTQFGFGFDTQGIFDYYAAGAGATADMIFNGFYVIGADENGDPFTGISIMAGITELPPVPSVAVTTETMPSRLMVIEVALSGMVIAGDSG